MKAAEVVAVVDAAERAGLRVWLDGGWGVDALLGRQHRRHADVDLVVDLDQVETLVAGLVPLGFTISEDYLPTRLVLRTSRGGQVDVHPVTFDEHGTGWQAGAGPGGGDCRYPAAGFTHGTVAGRRVGCLSPEVQVEHHQGYPHSDTDRGDLQRLIDAFGLDLLQGDR